MYAVDFEYDGQYLSNYDFIICNFGNASDTDTISAGSKITFNTVSRNGGNKYSLIGTSYDECIQTTFDICKNPELYDDLYITNDEYRDIMRWLNRKEFLIFQIFDKGEEQDSCYYNASFNISKILFNDRLYGLQLEMETDKPFGYGQEQKMSWHVNDTSKSKVICDMSDEIGYIYPSMKITVHRDGDLSIRNEQESCTMVIKNCIADEVISIDGNTLIVSSSIKSHRIYDDFNFEFFRIGNTINNRNNKISVSLPCDLEIRYSPIIKNTPD